MAVKCVHDLTLCDVPDVGFVITTTTDCLLLIRRVERDRVHRICWYAAQCVRCKLKRQGQLSEDHLCGRKSPVLNRPPE